MEWSDFQKFYEIVEKDNLSLFYRGDFSDGITDRLINISDLHFDEEIGQSGVRKRVAFLIAECFQNVVRHSEIDYRVLGLPEYSSYFMTRNIAGNFHIASGNLIQNHHIRDLKEKIDNINILSQDELKALYVKALGSYKFSSKGGAGLGLIEMARKSGRKLEVEFKKVSDQLTFFYLQILIESIMPEIHSPEDYRVCPIDIAIELNSLLQRNNILMAYQGDFKQDSILPLLNMINQNLINNEKKNTGHKYLFHVLVEMLQNIMHHGYIYNNKREGIFTIGTDDNLYDICTANYVENRKVPALKALLDEFMALPKEELKELYKKILKFGTKDPDGRAGLGIIDIIRSSVHKPEYKILPLDDIKSLFCLTVRV